MMLEFYQPKFPRNLNFDPPRYLRNSFLINKLERLKTNVWKRIREEDLQLCFALIIPMKKKKKMKDSKCTINYFHPRDLSVKSCSNYSEGANLPNFHDRKTCRNEVHANPLSPLINPATTYTNNHNHLHPRQTSFLPEYTVNNQPHDSRVPNL